MIIKLIIVDEIQNLIKPPSNLKEAFPDDTSLFGVLSFSFPLFLLF
jgi:hypothetical protein